MLENLTLCLACVASKVYPNCWHIHYTQGNHRIYSIVCAIFLNDSNQLSVNCYGNEIALAYLLSLSRPGCLFNLIVSCGRYCTVSSKSVLNRLVSFDFSEQCGEPAAHASEDRLRYEGFPKNGVTNDEPASIEVLRETADNKGAAVQCSARDEIVIPRVSHDDADRMEEAGGTARFSDDRSDSGVSSLRSCSGDERSGSRSSALSSSDEPPQQPVTTRSPLCGEIVRVWRDPNLTAEPRVRHVQSVQHQSLLMSLPQSNSASQPAASSAPPPGVSVPAMAMVQAQSAHYQPPQLNPPLLTSHSMLQPPGLYSPMTDLMWNKGYRLPVHHMLGSPDELLREDRERIYAQDRDRYR